MWKCQHFSDTKILREMEKCSIYHKYIFCNFKGLWILWITGFGNLKTSKVQKLIRIFSLYVDSPTLISRKIWVTEKLCNFHTVDFCQISTFWRKKCGGILTFKICIFSRNIFSFLPKKVYLRSFERPKAQKGTLKPPIFFQLHFKVVLPTLCK